MLVSMCSYMCMTLGIACATIPKQVENLQLYEVSADSQHVKKGHRERENRRGRRAHAVPGPAGPQGIPGPEGPRGQKGTQGIPGAGIVSAFGEAFLILEQDFMMTKPASVAMNSGGERSVNVQISAEEPTLTVLEAGEYQISAYLYAKAPNTSSSQVTIGLMVNGVAPATNLWAIPASYDVDGDSLNFTQSNQWIMKLNTGDGVTLCCVEPIPLDLYIPALSPACSASLSMKRIG